MATRKRKKAEGVAKKQAAAIGVTALAVIAAIVEVIRQYLETR